MWPWARSFHSPSPFLCEEPACHLRLRLLSPSLSKLQVFRPEPCVALRDLKVCLAKLCVCVGVGGCCWSNQMLSSVRTLDPLGICSCGPDCQLGNWDLELLFPFALSGAQP